MEFKNTNDGHRQYLRQRISITECAMCEVWTAEEDLHWRKDHKYCQECINTIEKENETNLKTK